MSYLLGIDVGTTRTAAAVGRSGGRPGEIEIVNLGDRASSVPSVLFVADDGNVLVGEAAERRAVTDPDHVVREFKRRIGDPTPVLVAGRPWAPEELSARLVRWVVNRVGQREGGPAMRIALAHPASWGGHKKALLGAALAGQGLTVSFIAEPQAAALHYAAAERVERGSTIAVYDFGGGTFDAAVVHKDGHGFSLLGRPEGLERLGGIDFDEVVFDHVRGGLPEAFDGLDETDPGVLSAVAAIRRECTEAKEALSSDTEVSIPVLTPAAQGSVRLHRSEFEAMIRPQVEETVDALRRAVGSAGLTPAQLSAVLLVGGSSRIPLVGQLVSEQLGRPVAVDADPKNAIAMGAALSLAKAASATGAAPAHVPAQRTGRTPMIGAAMGPAVAAPFAPTAAAATGGYRPTGQLAPTDPLTQRVAGTGSMPARVSAPPPRPAPYPDRPVVNAADPDYDYADSDRPELRPGRSPALLVSLGAAFAAMIVIGAAFLWPQPDRISADVSTRPTPAQSTVAPPPSSAPEEEEEPPPIQPIEEVKPSKVPRTSAAPVPTQVPTTTAQPTTTQPPPPTTTTTTPPASTTTTVTTTTVAEPPPGNEPEDPPPGEDPPGDDEVAPVQP